MKTWHHKITPVYQFAGFDWPRYVATLPRGTMAERLKHAKNRVCGPYYHAPKTGNTGQSFYLDSDFMPGLRWNYADEVNSDIRHTGWFTDEYGDFDKIRGIVFRLPKNRGFLAGWTMGVGMASCVDYDIFQDIEECAECADSMAENAAEREREYQESQREELAA